MRTRKNDLVSDDLKPFIGKIIKEYREKYNYSLEDLSKALGHKKNRQTLHKYENCTLNIPYDIFFEICQIFNIKDDILDNVSMSDDERKKIEKKLIKNYVNNMRENNGLSVKEEKIINTYKNASFESVSKPQELCIKLLDDSMAPQYFKNDKIYSLGQLLHAGVIGFMHPSTKKYMEFKVNLPDYFKNIISNL